MATHSRFTFWRIVGAALLLAALAATVLRFAGSLGDATNLSDRFPWGIWIGFDVLCGVGLAAGGFTLAATVHIFHLKRFEPIVRPAILTAFLGYLLVCAALMFDLGKPWNIWHPLVMWNPHSVMFEVGWCVMLYTTVLFLEFLPLVLERFRLERARRMMRRFMIPVVILGVILSTLHQSSLGTLFLIMPEKMNALWYTPLLPILFFVSAVATGLAMTIFESWHSARAFARQLEFPLIQKLARVLAVMIAVYLAMRFMDISGRHAWGMLDQPGAERWLFTLEIVLMAVPMLLLLREKTRRSPQAIYLSSVMYLLGFVTNRLNVGITSLERASGVEYMPKWSEVAVTLGLVAAGFAIFRLAAQHLPVFESAVEPAPPAAWQEEARGPAYAAAQRQ
ncbi:MAG: NrfD/PsrC family molybdoenzyme membrane anchor subunit [Bryobacteraceae bacterium]